MDSDFRSLSEDLKGNQDNPFTVTKAVDFSDQEIADLWVDLGTPGGLTALARPRSPMPMFITGGKGSGKTHLMRYLSYSNQLIRYKGNVRELLRRDSHIGIYVRFSGLNATKFNGKGQSADAWNATFSYYTELWLGQLTLNVLAQVGERDDEIRMGLEAAVPALIDLFTEPPRALEQSFSGLLAYLRDTQRSVDHAINNCGFTGRLDIHINLNSGALIFEAPRRIAKAVPLLRKTTFLYLLDEYEKLSLDQQKYVNTLVWEKEKPASLRIGARTYGIRTYETVIEREDLREGSEYEELQLDDRLRRSKHYPEFCRRIIARRLNGSDLKRTAGQAFDETSLDKYFVSPTEDRLLSTETQFVHDKYAPAKRPYFLKLKGKLDQALVAREAPGVENREHIREVIEALQKPESPLAEKINIFLLYRSWARGESLRNAATAIRKQCEAYLRRGTTNDEYARVVEKFQYDLLAQLLRECKQRQRYYGLDAFIWMSAGQPRNLLTILKHVYSWAEFRDENPFGNEPISIDSQQLGVIDAADWFLKNARIPGAEGPRVHEGIRRLAELFREIRFSDKPSECSLVTFSVNSTSLDSETRELLKLAVNWSLLIRIQAGQKDRNSMRIDDKYQLNPMVAPLWQLPIFRRGAIALEPREVEAVFSSAGQSNFEEVLRSRVARMQAPFTARETLQTGLFDHNED